MAPAVGNHRTSLLLTGAPGVGKTTVLRKLVPSLRDRPLRGFLTDEIRERGERVGFRIESFGGRSATLAHVDFDSPRRVGRYGVDVPAFEAIVIDVLDSPSRDELFVVDEIGKMECLSRRFVELVTHILDSPAPILATVAKEGGGLIGEVKQRPDIELWEVTKKNRESLPHEVLERLRDLG